MSDISKVLYHYCDSAAFYSIISNKNFRLSNVFESNDYLERKWIDKHIDKAFQDMTHEIDQFKIFKTSVSTNYKLNRDIAPYAIAFSGEKDLLSQWRGYANDANGFAIGINIDYFGLENRIPFTSPVPDYTIGIFEILYYEPIIHLEVAKIINYYWMEFNSEEYTSNSTAMSKCAGELVKLSSRVKNPKFSEEKEWRILYTPFIVQEMVSGKFTDMMFRTTNNCLKSFFEMPFKEKKEMCPISEIIIGPKNRTSEETLRYFINLQGLKDCKISRSELSYQ